MSDALTTPFELSSEDTAFERALESYAEYASYLGSTLPTPVAHQGSGYLPEYFVPIPVTAALTLPRP